jgi:hypothetical protein
MIGNRSARSGTLFSLVSLVLGLAAPAAQAQPEPAVDDTPGDSVPPTEAPADAAPDPAPQPVPPIEPAPVAPVPPAVQPAPSTPPPAPIPPQAARESAPERNSLFDHLRMGGYFQPAFVAQGDTEFNKDDADGFAFRNARLTGEGKLPIDELLASSFTFNFDVSTGVFLVRDVYGSVHLGEDWLSVDVGQMKAPFLLAEMVSEAKLQFATPSAGMRRMAYGRDRGIRARGEVVLGGVYAGWAGAMQNGEGATVTQNSDSEYLYTGRLEVGPLGKVPLDEPDLEDSPFAFVLGGAVGHTESTTRKDLGLDDAGARETRMEGDLRLRFRGLTFRAELLKAQVHREDAGVRFGRYGFHAQAGYVLPLPVATKFEVVGRLEQIDLNDEQDGVVQVGGTAGTDDPERLTSGTAARQYTVPDNSEVRRIELGANAYVVDHRLKVQASYVRTDYQEGPKTEGGGNPIVGDLVQVQLQFGWM